MSRVVVYEELGGPEALRVVDAPAQVPGPGQVLVRVRAAALNPYDAKVRDGFIPLQAAFPRRIGTDLAGTVIDVGEGERYWDGSAIAVGDEVIGGAHGSLADEVLVDAAELTLRPVGLDSKRAAGLHVAGLTALSVTKTVPVTEADTVLVGGASGAVGFVAAQLALAAGARVIGSANPRNHELLASVGIEPVTYGEGLAERVREFGEVTAVYDCHSREALDAGVELGVPRNRMVATSGYGALDELGVLNVERAARTAENLARLADGVVAGEIQFPVAQTFALADVVNAFRALESTHPVGKIVVVP